MESLYAKEEVTKPIGFLIAEAAAGMKGEKKEKNDGAQAPKPTAPRIGFLIAEAAAGMGGAKKN